MNCWISVQALYHLNDVKNLSQKKQEKVRLPQSSPFVLYLEEKPIADIQPHIALLPLPFLLDISCIKAVVKPKQI